jgi:hypothetical protein
VIYLQIFHILNRQKNYFSQLHNVHRVGENYFSHIMNVHTVSNFRQLEIHTGKPSLSEVEIAIAKLERYK